MKTLKKICIGILLFIPVIILGIIVAFEDIVLDKPWWDDRVSTQPKYPIWKKGWRKEFKKKGWYQSIKIKSK